MDRSNPRYVGQKEAARMLGCTPRTVRRYQARGLLRATKRPGCRAYFSVREVIRFAEGRPS